MGTPIRISGAYIADTLRLSYLEDHTLDFLKLASDTLPTITVDDLYLIVSGRATFEGDSVDGLTVVTIPGGE